MGINCTKVGKPGRLVRQFEDAARLQALHLPHLVVYPDGATDSVYNTTTMQWEVEPAAGGRASLPWPEETAQMVQEICVRDAWQGVVVGGCCKTTPSDIRALGMGLRNRGRLLEEPEPSPLS